MPLKLSGCRLNLDNYTDIIYNIFYIYIITITLRECIIDTGHDYCAPFVDSVPY